MARGVSRDCCGRAPRCSGVLPASAAVAKVVARSSGFEPTSRSGERRACLRIAWGRTSP